MKLRLPLFALSVFLAAGCSQTPEPAPPADHPANPRAAEVPQTTKPAAAKAEADSGAAPTAYTCPHHPKVMQADSGDCPLCGMKLEPTVSRQTSPLRGVDDKSSVDSHKDHR